MQFADGPERRQPLPEGATMTDWLDSWRRAAPFPQADWQTWFAGLGAPPGLATGPLPGTGATGPWPDLGAAAAAYTALARELARFAELARSTAPPPAAGPSAAAGAAAGVSEELAAFARRLFSQALPRWPGADAAFPEWARALENFNAVLAEAAREAATRYGALLRGESAPTTLRGLFDAWIDCAEAAFQSAAHTERYASAQATLINEFATLRARQQELAERAARALGQPTRAEVDALHATVRELRAELAALRAAAAQGGPPAGAGAGRARAARRRAQPPA